MSDYKVVVEQLPDNIVVVEETNYAAVVEHHKYIAVEMSVGPQGPEGPPGLNEADMPWTRRIDFITEELLYKGEAPAGALDSDPVWRIHKTVITNQDVVETWADGNALFDNVWNDRLTLVYS